MKQDGKSDVKPLDYETPPAGPPAWHQPVRWLLATAITAAFACGTFLILLFVAHAVSRLSSLPNGG